MWRGGPLAGECSEANRHPGIAPQTLTMLQQSWSATVTRDSWSNVLSPLPGVADLREPEPKPLEVPASPLISGWATHYGVSYQDGCSVMVPATTRPTNPDIVAVGPSRYEEWPCGTKLRVCGPAGCLTATRHDACPGCSAKVLDLSEGGKELVCGIPPHTCRVTIQVIEVPQPPAEDQDSVQSLTSGRPP